MSMIKKIFLLSTFILIISLSNTFAENLKKVGKNLRFQFDVIKKLNIKITPKEILNSRKQFRTSIIVRNIYSEVLNIIQPIVINKIKKNRNIKDKNYLNDALLTSIAGISAAMKNTG